MNDAASMNRPAPEGWVIQSLTGNFAWHAGPFYFRKAGPTPGIGFFSEPHHANKADSIHGGALLTLADMSLFDICHRKLGPFKAVTITLNTEFLSPAPVGAFIEATGEMMGGGKKLLIARGLVTTGGRTLVSFSGTLRRFE